MYQRTDEATSQWAGTRGRTILAATSGPDLSGRVIDANGRAVPGAVVLVPRHELHARTDDGGRFRLPAPPTHAPTTLVVRAGERQQQFELVRAGGRTAGVVIRLGF
jgi:hypothetical protein